MKRQFDYGKKRMIHSSGEIRKSPKNEDFYYSAGAATEIYYDPNNHVTSATNRFSYAHGKELTVDWDKIAINGAGEGNGKGFGLGRYMISMNRKIKNYHKCMIKPPEAIDEEEAIENIKKAHE